MAPVGIAAALAVFLLLCAAVLAATGARSAARAGVASAILCAAAAAALAVSAEVRIRDCRSAEQAAAAAWERTHPPARSALEEILNSRDFDYQQGPPTRVCERAPF